ncbi:antitoxin Xre/MbcA/ParS toxin-binding domain-containing protein [Niveibacterium sp.]|uniref:antitoxin Xre/MbcA/ParS toxin-binding domain-containing protein n=1 Tax=Niveibacterium sp. TaxID=2017444 RepID=UPI0035B452A4
MIEYGGQAPTTTDRSRILTAALFEVATRLDISAAELGSAIGVDRSTVSRMKQHGRGLKEGSKTWELSVQVVRMYRSLFALVGGQDEAARQWFNGAIESFGGQSPRAMIRRIDGLVRVCDYLDAYRAQN